MKTLVIAGAAVGAVFIVTGCATTGLSSREQHNSYAELINNLYRKAPAGDTGKSMHTPLDLAVAQIGEATPDAGFVKELGRRQNLVRKVIEIPLPGEPPRYYNNYGASGESARERERRDILADQVNGARNLARELGAQQLLLVGGSIDSYSSRTPLTVLDLTIIGGAVAPGVKVHSNGKAAGALIDVESGRVEFLADAQLSETGLTPSFYADEKRDSLNAKLRADLLKELAGNVLERLSQAPATKSATR